MSMKYLGLSGGIAFAAAGYSHAGEKNYSPYVNQSFPQNVYFGDTHLHTAYYCQPGVRAGKYRPAKRDAQHP